MKPVADVTLSILVARTDVRFMMHTIPHLVRMNNYPFAERVLVVDTMPLSGQYRNRPGIGTMEELRDCCTRLKEAGVIDRIVEIDYSRGFRRRAYRKHFGRDIGHTHNTRGYPILGSVFALESCQTRYFLHFDSDMLMWQSPAHSWIDDGVRLLRSRPEVLCVLPLAGPPHPDGALRQQVEYRHDPNGFYCFKAFTSRKFLVDRERFDLLLPMRPNILPRRARLRQFLTGKSALCPWEAMVTESLMSSQFIRADLDSPRAWTLHTPDHGPRFLQYLPEVLCLIETGEFPPEQAGDYDLMLEPWISMIEARQATVGLAVANSHSPAAADA